ncbi:MAG: hypothetical protein ACRENJ_07110 [Candidatus Eiseniibacteriota bacterium]
MNPTRRLELALVALLAAYAWIAYGHALQLAFVNDDYLFLEKVRERGLWRSWLPEELIFDWYRPWSRETHYWVLNRIFGLHEPSFHVVSLLLALAVLVLYFRLARRLLGAGPAGIATGAMASLGLWSTPVLWVAGAQDLWMLLFGLLFLHAALAGRGRLACLPLTLALLSKETAAVLPAIASAAGWVLQGRPLRAALARTAGYWAIAAAWALAHPTLRARLGGAIPPTIEAEQRPAGPVLMLRTVLAQANLEIAFAPEGGWAPVLLKGLAGGLILCALLWLAFRSAPPDSGTTHALPTPGRVVAFGGCWAALGFAILFMPSIGWHAYYGVLGSFGIWLALGSILARHRSLAMAAILALALTREARAATPSWDWGTDWYQARAGAILALIRERLFRFHPKLPAHSRLYFARLPNNIGMLAGDGPALRIWYDDPSVVARYYSAYAPRAPLGPAGPDYFFRFDTVQVLVEVHAGPEPLPAAMGSDPGWQRDHEMLAALFVRAGNLAGAAAEYGKLSRAIRGRPDYALYAGAAHEAIGALAEAGAFYRIAAQAYGDSIVRARAAELTRAARHGVPQKVRAGP